MERGRRGRRHAARLGSLAALAHAPYGSRSVGRPEGVDPPRSAVVRDAARVVRQAGEWGGRDRRSMGAGAWRLPTRGVPTRPGKSRWERGPVGAMLTHPPSQGEAAYGRTRSGPWQRHPRRPGRGQSAPPRQPATKLRVSPADWITVAVPPLVDAELFDAVPEQVREQPRRKRERMQGPRYRRHGVLVCGSGGYAIPGSTVSSRTPDGHPQQRRSYRGRGRAAPRGGGAPWCPPAPLAASPVEAAVWAEGRALRADPTRLDAEEARRATARPDSSTQTERRATAALLTTLRQGLAGARSPHCSL